MARVLGIGTDGWGLGASNRKPSRPRQPPPPPRWTRPDTVGSETMGSGLPGGATNPPVSHILVCQWPHRHRPRLAPVVRYGVHPVGALLVSARAARGRGAESKQGQSIFVGTPTIPHAPERGDRTNGGRDHVYPERGLPSGQADGSQSLAWRSRALLSAMGRGQS